ncbi:MAG: apolipoprotein N-acyltransferase [Brachymonas sp.]|nr:apolipoprotein N-acyltransferase [Brachymonas sp.]
MRLETQGQRSTGLAAAVLRYALLALLGAVQAFSIAWPWGEAGQGMQGQAFGSLQILALAAALWLIAGGQLPLIAGAARDLQADSKSTAGVTSVRESVSFGTARSRLWQRWASRFGQVFWAGFWRGWCFATAWLAATFWWLYISLHVYGGLPAWLSALAVFLLAAALGLYYAVACGLWLRGSARQGAVGQVLLFAALWLLAELCRGVLFTGFPWGAVGYAHVDSGLAGYAPWLGVYGLSALAAALAALLWQALRLLRGQAGQGKPLRFAAGAAVVAASVVAVGAWHKHGWQGKQQPLAGGNTLSVALLQGNIPQEEKFQPNGGMELALDWYGQQMMASQADLVVLPETALPLFPQQLPEGYWPALQQRFGRGGQTVLIGIPAGDLQAGYANAVVGMAPGGVQTVGGGETGSRRSSDFYLPPAAQAEYRYAKHHLVPFGEFIPWGFQWFVDMMRIPLGNFQRGAVSQPRLLVQGERVQPNICYEDLFGEELAASFADAATAPTLLVNMSNIAWFGDTVAIDQHRHISRMRAMELARPMLRATNTGATAVIDATGRVVQEFPRLQRGVLQAEVKGNHAPPTFFAWWAARFGLWPLWLIAAATVALLGWRGRVASDKP